MRGAAPGSLRELGGWRALEMVECDSRLRASHKVRAVEPMLVRTTEEQAGQPRKKSLGFHVEPPLQVLTRL